MQHGDPMNVGAALRSGIADIGIPNVVRGGSSNDFPWYALRFWHGMRAGALRALFARHGWRIDNWAMALSAGGLSPINSLSSFAQRVCYAGQIAKTEIKNPIFILGHWRSGTTMLHEYLGLNEKFRAPTTLETACPEHFLLSEWFVKRFLACPNKRPMDEMEAGWHKPQECEFALMGMGLDSMYTHLGFPADEVEALNTLNFSETPRSEIEKWGRGLRRFFQSMLVRKPGQLLLKSPTHTGRIAQLLELFPDAKFIHIARDPQSFIPSTLHLWRQLGKNCSFQSRESSRDLGFVMDCFTRMYDGYFTSVKKIPSGNLIEFRYEDFVEDPFAGVANIYETLGLDGFPSVESVLRQEIAARANYRRNMLDVSSSMAREIQQTCGHYAERFGY